MGRYSNAKRAELAAKAATEASKAAVNVTAEPSAVEPVESDSARPAPEKVFKNPRDGMMDEVIARHYGKAAEEPEAEPKEEPKTEPEAPKVEAKPEEPTPEAKPEPAPEPAPEVPAVKYVRAKVDGEEFDVLESEINEAGGLRAYQIQKAGENRLKKAQDILAEARRIQTENTPKIPQVTDDEFWVSKVDTMLFGETPAARAAAFRDALQRSNPKTDSSVIINQAVTQIKRDTAIAKFREEFSEIAANPLLMKLAGTLENEVIAKIPPEALANPQFVSQFDWNDFYRRIGNQVRGAVGRPSQPPQPSQTNGTPSLSPDKEARKASIVNLPTAAARAEQPKEAKPETRADILNDMRKSRGLPTE